VTEDDTRLWGVVSDRDILATAATGEIARQTAGGSAATQVLTVGAQESLRRAAELMNEKGLTHVIVVNPGTDRPVGVLSTLDIAAVVGGVARREEAHGATRVAGVMTTPVISVPPEMPLKDVAVILVEHRISGVPVVHSEEVVGVLSEADIVAGERASASADRKGPLAWLMGGGSETITSRLAARTAGEAMSTPAITIDSWQSAAAAAAMMTEHGVKRLPVLKNGALVGIISCSDLVRAFARTDAELERDIRENVISRGLWLSPTEITVEIRGGEVELSGTVDREIDVETLVHQVGRVPGVVSVTPLLTVCGTTGAKRRRFRRLSRP
jgi:CBS domain-containing protein